MQETNRFGIPYYYISVSKQTKVEQEKSSSTFIRHNIEFVVLARYMQI